MDLKKEVMELDRQFSKDCEKGKEEAWASYFAEDGLMIIGGSSNHVIGKKAIKEIMKPLFALPELDFTWEPDYCEISEDGTLAVTRGTSKRSYLKDGKTISQKGNYTTIWKRQNGSWKISWDIGN